MRSNFIFYDKTSDKQGEQPEAKIVKQGSCLNDTDFCLTEVDFYPPSDNRVWKSNIKDINGGDNFVDYCTELFEMLEEEEYYDN